MSAPGTAEGARGDQLREDGAPVSGWPVCDPRATGAPGAGPLAGLWVLEAGGNGPVPFAGMVLSDLGANVLRLERPSAAPTAGPRSMPRAPDQGDGPAAGTARRPGDGWPWALSAAAGGSGPLGRGRRALTLDLRSPAGREVMRRLLGRADVLLEGFRPGVMERLGWGPEECLALQPALIYGRMTGFGQSGPLSQKAGHDLDYIALAGALAPIGPAGGLATPPVNLVADFGGGAMLLLVGVLSALLERAASGRGQVVDAAMVDGAALLTTMLHGLRAEGAWVERRSANLLDGGAPFYSVYRTADRRELAVAALEEPFYADFVRGLDLDPTRLPDRANPAHWPVLRQVFAERIASRPLCAWEAIFSERDGCVAPVLWPSEAPRHPHLVARRTFVEVGGVEQPAPAPRFSRTPPDRPRPGGPVDRETLSAWGLGVDLWPSAPLDEPKDEPSERLGGGGGASDDP